MSFIVLDGIDGCGKSSHARRLAARLKDMGRDVILIKEPSEISPAGESLYKLIKSGKRPSPQEELRLFIEDRKWDVENRILPAIRDGKDIVLDRYFYSTVAYQGARGIDSDEIWKMNSFAPVPDIAIILDIEPSAAMERIKRRKNGTYFEEEEYLRRVREIFLSMKSRPEVEIVDSSGSYESTQNAIWALVRRIIP